MKIAWRRGRRAGVAMVAALALGLAACGGGADDAADEGAAGEEDAADDAEADSTDDAAEDDQAGEAEGEEPADSDERPLEGELITFLVGSSPGGGFDTYTRLIAPFLAEELGADVTVENMPGAGGLLELNNLWVAEPDGTTIGMVNGAGVVGSVLAGAPGMEFELDQFSWLARVAGEERLFSVNASGPYESADELVGLSEPFRFSATGPGGGTYNDAVLTCEVFEMTDCDVVTGFDGSSEARLAVTAGEVNAVVTTADSGLNEVEAGDHRALALVGSKPLDALPDVPIYSEVEGLSEEGRKIAKAQVSIAEAGRSVAAPPDMPEDVLAELRRAFETVLTSEEFLAEAETQGRPIGYMPAEEYEALVQEALQAPDIVGETLAQGIE